MSDFLRVITLLARILRFRWTRLLLGNVALLSILIAYFLPLLFSNNHYFILLIQIRKSAFADLLLRVHICLQIVYLGCKSATELRRLLLRGGFKWCFNRLVRHGFIYHLISVLIKRIVDKFVVVCEAVLIWLHHLSKWVWSATLSWEGCRILRSLISLDSRLLNRPWLLTFALSRWLSFL